MTSPVQPPVASSSSTSTRHVTVAKKSLEKLMGHDVTMLEALKGQNKTIQVADVLIRQTKEFAVTHASPVINAKKIETIYETAEKEVKKISDTLAESVEKGPARQKAVKEAEKKKEYIETKIKLSEEKEAKLQEKLGQVRTKHEGKIASLKKEYNDALDRSLSPGYGQKADRLYGQLGKAEQAQRKEEIPLEKEIAKEFEKLEFLKNLKKQAESEIEGTLTKDEIAALKKSKKQAEKKAVKVIQETQVKVVADIAEQIAIAEGLDPSGLKEKVSALAQEGWSGKAIRLLATFSKTHRTAIRLFTAAKESMVQAQTLPANPVTELDYEKSDESARLASLERRANVIGVNGIYRFGVTFSEKVIKKQLQSFTAQILSDEPRVTIPGRIVINKHPFTSLLIPLNVDFDESLVVTINSVVSNVSSFFKGLFGNKGISSMNRQEAHLVNGWESNLMDENQNTLFKALRHAIASDINERDAATRKQNSEKAAEELIKAALLQEIQAKGLTVSAAAGSVIELNLNSVSLVTPDDIRPYWPGQDDERQMLLDQVLALKKFDASTIDEKTGQPQGAVEMDLDGKKIQVKLNVNAFNFGVNAGAVTALPFISGLANQYVYNKKAMEGLRSQVVAFYQIIAKEISSLPSADAKRARLLDAKDIAQDLLNDIQMMMDNEKAYLKGGNQYEIGAKILNLSNVIDQTINEINIGKKQKEKIPSIRCAFNCKSGKDRTGIMDGVAKTFAIMAQENHGKYWKHEDFERDPALKKKFAEILFDVLKKGGGLKITDINTDVSGYKVQKEAGIFGMSIDELKGLSPLTAS